jgi:hypothetical protein
MKTLHFGRFLGPVFQALLLSFASARPGALTCGGWYWLKN